MKELVKRVKSWRDEFKKRMGKRREGTRRRQQGGREREGGDTNNEFRKTCTINEGSDRRNRVKDGKNRNAAKQVKSDNKRDGRGGARGRFGNRGKVQKLLEEWLGVTETEVTKSYRLVWKREGERPIKIRCNSEWQRQEILEQKRNLKGTKVYIHEDLTGQEKEQKRRTMEDVRRLREERKTPWLRGIEVLMDDKVYVWKEDNQGLVEVNKDFLGNREWRRSRQRVEKEIVTEEVAVVQGTTRKEMQEME